MNVPIPVVSSFLLSFASIEVRYSPLTTKTDSRYIEIARRAPKPAAGLSEVNPRRPASNPVNVPRPALIQKIMFKGCVMISGSRERIL